MIRTPIDFAGKQVVLLLQGGGALGAYQVGAYAALDQALRDAKRPGVDWIGGISIGAINAAVIAGPNNPQKDPVAALDSLWSDILSPDYPPFDFLTATKPFHFLSLDRRIPKYWNWTVEAFGPLGQKNFFTPRPAWPLLFSQWFRPLALNELGFYDTAPLRETLDRHVNWNAIVEAGKQRQKRLLLGATSVQLGELRLFDSFAADTTSKSDHYVPVTMSAKHVLASGALPPAFPPVDIGDDDAYFDGGVSSNTLITELRRELAGQNTIVFLVDLWDRKGKKPQTMDEVIWRQKCIQFGSRKHAAEWVVEEHQLRAQCQPKSKHPAKLEVCQVMFESDDHSQFALSDADFSRETFGIMRSKGKADMERMLTQPHQVDIEGANDPISTSGTYAVLYRVGTHNKHLKTDKELAAAI